MTRAASGTSARAVTGMRRAGGMGAVRAAMLAAATLLATLLVTAMPAVLPAQSLAARVAEVRNGTVRFAFEAAEGVCGSGDDNISFRREGRSVLRTGPGRRGEWETECEHGPVRVAVDVSRGEVTAVRSYAAGRWRGEATRDLGMVEAGAAREYLLRLVETARASVAKDAVLPAMMAAGAEPWERLLRVARDESRPRDVRSAAVFWVGQGAAEAATRGLEEIVDDAEGDREVRKSAVFALSQRPADESVPALIRVARTHRDPDLRRTAIFWLGQTRDPRALAYFESVLTGR